MERILLQDISEDDDALRIIEDLAFANQNEMDLDTLIYSVNRVYGKLRGQLGPISYLMDEDDISEIMVNGFDEIYVERNGQIEHLQDSYDSRSELEQVIRRIAATVRREVNEMNPILDARLKDGSRVNAVLRNVALDGPSLTVRKFRRRIITIEEMVRTEGLTADAADILKDLVAAGYNVFISGGTSSGKTTFLNALSEFIPEDERVVTIEDSAELQLKSIKNIVRLECRTANSSGQGDIRMNDLIRNSLRMRPDRIIVGEVRGGEVSDMLQALNTGHSGMSTGHGNSIGGMLRRLEAMYISGSSMPMDAIRAQIVEGIDIMIQLVRLKNGKRKVVEISELVGFDGRNYELNRLFAMDENLSLRKTGNVIRDHMKLTLSKKDD